MARLAVRANACRIRRLILPAEINRKKPEEIKGYTDLLIIPGEMPVVSMQYSTHKPTAKSGIQGSINMYYGDYS